MVDKIEAKKYVAYIMGDEYIIPTLGVYNSVEEIDFEKKYKSMLELVAKLSKGIPQVRVDFYNINGKIYFGELTFFHWNGLVPYEPKKYDEFFGSYMSQLEKVA